MAITDSGLGQTRGSNRVGATINAVLKEYYLPGVREQLNNTNVLARYMKRKSDSIEGGKKLILELHTGRNEGIGHISESGRLPDPLSQTYKQAEYHMKYGYGRIMFTGPSAAATKGDRGSFVRIMDSEIRGLTKDINRDVNRIMFGDGSGRLTRLVARLSANVYSTADAGGITNTGSGTKYLTVGMRVGAVSSDTASVKTNAAPSALFGSNRAGTITAVDHTAGTVTLSSDITLTGTNYLYRVSDIATDTGGGDWARGKEPNGLAAIVSDANPVFQDGLTDNWVEGLGGVPVATFPVWKSPVIGDGTPVPFSPDMLQQIQDQIDIASGGSVEMYMTTHGIRRQYLNSLVGSKRYPNTMNLDGGYKALSYSGTPLVVDRDCTPGRCYALNLDNMFLAYETDWDWLDKDGSILHRLPNQDAWQACIARYWQVATDARNQQGLVTDIQES